MRTQRLHITVRTLMIAVAVLAVILSVLISAARVTYLARRTDYRQNTLPKANSTTFEWPRFTINSPPKHRPGAMQIWPSDVPTKRRRRGLMR